MHTPGPWRAEREDRRSWAIKSEDFGTIAYIHDPYADDSASRARLEMNACLIAAAPELLRALKAALWEIESNGDSIGAVVGVLESEGRAAIAKAESRT